MVSFIDLNGLRDLIAQIKKAINQAVPAGIKTGYITTGKQDYSALGNNSTAEGTNVIASGDLSHAEGNYTEASGEASHAEGSRTVASADYAHAEGFFTAASESATHAEGYRTNASSIYAHAEGYYGTASGFASHAEGSYTVSSGDRSHAQNYGTEAYGFDQTVIGRYNAKPSTPRPSTSGGQREWDAVNQKLALIIGNGSSDSQRSNALTVDWNGNVVTSGTINGQDIAIIADLVEDMAERIGDLEAENTALSGIVSRIEALEANYDGLSGIAGRVTTLEGQMADALSSK